MYVTVKQKHIIETVRKKARRKRVNREKTDLTLFFSLHNELSSNHAQ